MRKIITTAAAMAFVIQAAMMAQEVGFAPAVSNVFIPWEQVAATPDGAFPADNWFIGGELFWRDDITEELSYETRYAFDPILRSALYMTITFDSGFARMTVGPFLGLFNTLAVPIKSGLSTRISLEWPGIAFASVAADNSLGGSLSAEGDYLQEFTEISGGFYFPNVILTLSMVGKRFQLRYSPTLTTTDSITTYAAILEIFKKNSPFNLFCTMGWQIMSKTWDDGTPETDTMGSLIVGIRVRSELFPGFTMLAGLESTMFSLGLDDLAGQGPAANSFMFSATIGFSIDIDELRNAPTALPQVQTTEEPQAEPSSSETDSTDTGESDEPSGQ
jgi:hypothetical protein